MKLALKEAKAYTFYATDCESGKTITLRFDNKEKSGLMVGSIVDVEVEAYGKDFKFLSLLSEQMSDGREKVVVDFGDYKIGDKFEETVIFGLGAPFLKSGKKVQYAYFK
jgi:hypothetical protein